MKKISQRLFLIIVLAILFFSFTQTKPQILIIGDSVSKGYTPFVQENLANKANVFHNDGNAKHTGNGLKNIDEWISHQPWDIIQFNWGLWDLCYRHPDSKVQGNRDKENGTITFTLEEYALQLDSLVTILQTKTDAKLIFVTTTYVPEHEAGRFKADALRYNEVAKKIMKNHAVMVNDIYAASIPIHQEFGKGADDVHYTRQGYEKLSMLITEFLSQEIVSMNLE